MSKLPTGMQWVAHCGKAAQARIRRQRERLEAKAAKARYGVEVDANGRTPAGLIVPGAVASPERPS